MSDLELEYLENISLNKRIIVYDEDSYSGNTLSVTSTFLDQRLFPELPIITLTNYDTQNEEGSLEESFF